MEMPKQVVILDSSQIDAYLTCPQMHNYNYTQSLVQAGTSSKKDEAMLMGTYGHKMLEIYYKCLGRGKTPTNAIEAAEAFNPDNETCTCGHSEMDHLTTGCLQNKCECKEWKPQPFPLDVTVRSLVKQRFREYCWTYAANDFKPISDESVELGFSYNLYEDDNYLFILEGRIDILGTIGGMPIFADHKFQLRARDLYKKSIQFRNYALASERSTGIINYIRLTKKVDNTTYKRDVTSFSRAELLDWKEQLIQIYYQIAEDEILIPLNKHIYKNYAACSGKFGYPCNYTQLCEEIDPKVRENKLVQLYTKRQEWKPW
jgi:PD-(D/E)XK nuclease superfamily